MSWFKKALAFGAAPLTGGASLAYLPDKAKREAEDAQKASQNTFDSQQNSAMAGAEARTNELQKKYYGNSLSTLGADVTDQSNRLKSLLDKDVARADMVNQQSSSQRALDNARAGLSGADMSAQNEQTRRNAGFEANVINEEAQRQALGLYGDSLSNRITGANTIESQQKALAIASLQQPQTQSNPGLIGQIFGGLF